jgi:ribosomal protein S18 acetylase RimI-like enzyme
MLDTLYSEKSLQNVMRDGSQKFIILKDNYESQGFASYGIRQDDILISKLHKLYVMPGQQGKGYGRLLVEAVKERILKNGIRVLDLNVNRHNPAKFFYEKLGFKIIRQEDVPIGPYWMNDYVMRLTF